MKFANTTKKNCVHFLWTFNDKPTHSRCRTHLYIIYSKAHLLTKANFLEFHHFRQNRKLFREYRVVCCVIPEYFAYEKQKKTANHSSHTASETKQKTVKLFTFIFDIYTYICFFSCQC